MKYKVVKKIVESFDIVDIPEHSENEIPITQYLRPGGQKRQMFADVGKEIASLTKDLILSAEELSSGQVAIYVRSKDETDEQEIMEIAENGPGEKSPTNILIKLIKRKVKNQ